MLHCPLHADVQASVSLALEAVAEIQIIRLPHQ